MSMKEHANRILNRVENDLLAAQRDRDEIRKAMEMLASAGIPDDLLDALRPELEKAKNDVAELTIHRMLVRSGMRNNHWLDD